MNSAIIRDRIQTAANIAIILAVCLIGGVIVRDYIAQRTNSRGISSRGISTGTRISVPEIDFARVDRTLLIALRQGCRYCDESAPFYKNILARTKDDPSVHVMAILQQPTEASRKSLEGLGVGVEDVKRVHFSTIGIGPTPTMLLVDRQGTVKRLWVGKLASEKEADVFKEIGH